MEAIEKPKKKEDATKASADKKDEKKEDAKKEDAKKSTPQNESQKQLQVDFAFTLSHSSAVTNRPRAFHFVLRQL